MQFMDSKERYYMREIARLVSGKHTESLGNPEGSGTRSVELGEIKKMVDGATYDEPRVMRALDRMVHSGALQKSGFRWMTTPRFAAWFRDLDK